MAIAEILTNLAETYGYAGVLIASLLGSIVPFLPVPYLIVVALLSDILDPLLLGIIAGIGGSFGKITSYALGRGGYRLFKPGTKRKMDALRALIGKYGDLGVFIFALTPLPDDVYLIPIGMMRFTFWRFLMANTAGKVILSTFVAYAGQIYFEKASEILGEADIYAMAAAIAFMIVLTVILIRVDWERILLGKLQDQAHKSHN